MNMTKWGPEAPKAANNSQIQDQGVTTQNHVDLGILIKLLKLLRMINAYCKNFGSYLKYKEAMSLKPIKLVKTFCYILTETRHIVK